ncbi:MAG: aminotransferase class IV, partial [Muribaculaceae bacterium]|nr:aminotransferase class IV [Muribaculaceae bacterium]
QEKKYLDECGPANFFAIKDGKYITPKSDSILPSITNDSLMVIAREMGMEVERRHITVDELEHVSEAAACGTAAVCSPIGEIDDIDTGKKYVISKDGKPGPITTEFVRRLEAIRNGEEPDTHGWITIVE